MPRTTDRARAPRSRAAAYEASEDVPVNPSDAATLGDVVQGRFSRRALLKGALATSAIAGLFGSSLAAREGEAASGGFAFDEIGHGVDETHHVAAGYDADVLIRWGDPVEPGAPAFDPANQTAASQSKQFGYNNDFVGFVSLPYGSRNAAHGLLCVNHEYTSEEVMFPGVGEYDETLSQATRELVEIEMAAHGGSVTEVRRAASGKWQVVADSPLNRRITALATEMRLTGPAAGHARMKTTADPTGARVIGTINNCAGGITPWGTYLMAEENFHGYFRGTLTEDHPEARNHARYGVPKNWYAWGRYHRRFDIGAEPNEANRFGWIVEVDPYDPQSLPVKRTALGRFKHEGAEPIVNGDGRVVVYSGDDQRFEYLYKFVSHGRFDPARRGANMTLLDAGTLHVARFHADGTLDWLPLVFGTEGLTPENGFHSQADVLIETRAAADVLGATPMDRPEDVSANPLTGKVHVMLTNNSKRTANQVDAANTRAENRWGQIAELTPPAGDHGALRYGWEILVQCGDPKDGAVGATWNPATSRNGWFSCPDNAAVDGRGRLWITTDQGSAWSEVSGTADGVWALETEGAARGTGKMFFRVPIGAEMCGPCFAPDDQTLFVAVQHVATDGTETYPGFERLSTYEDPATRWPDFDPAMPPRPSVVAITKQGGGQIGG